ncbi:hypothetical protein [Notoacmeibacter ruber]|uniref:Nutrient deprivation-induced protein n=1 Tax=Notoacmeibacter ruber TaxID=2670375 RepID=A0A3L7JDG1_9HYPH|nr:hypothetical protein [Notoacmeibacter ruber]RLQ88723.1 hypothetical protein D8780_11375 [Notoacmeibacter ruber]
MPQDHSPQGAADKAKSDAAGVRQAAQREADAASSEASRASSDIKAEAAHLADKAKQEGLHQAERGKETAASTVNDFAASVRAAADKLGERDQSMSANLVREAARGLEDVSGAISGRSVGEIVNNVSGFARRQPTAFMVGAALTGIALGRFARASNTHTARDYGETPPPPAPYTPTLGSPAATSSASSATGTGTVKPSTPGPSTSTSPSARPSPSTTSTSNRTPTSGGTISGGTNGPIGQTKKGD